VWEAEQRRRPAAQRPPPRRRPSRPHAPWRGGCGRLTMYGGSACPAAPAGTRKMPVAVGRIRPMAAPPEPP
jgi:hypothetical protein